MLLQEPATSPNLLSLLPPLPEIEAPCSYNTLLSVGV